MIFIAESGSTKCDWVLINRDGEEVGRWNTMGFNPYFHSSDLIRHKLSQERGMRPYLDQVLKVWFYGAGCSTPELQSIVVDGLQQVFTNADINVDHDLNAAAYALYDGRPEIACILGTGSNSCYFDGYNVREEVPALAYVLGDEGSASWIGKRLVADYLYKRLPSDLACAFEDTYRTSKDEVIQRVYNEPHANVYLASFSRFAGDHAGHSWIRAMVANGFAKFIDIHVRCFEEAHDAEVNFVGSVAKQFEDILKTEVKKAGFTYGRTQAKPVNLLVKYHIERLRVLEDLKKV
ncbi:MAG: ATPase [Flavobacteriia bacterium]|nr:ATPase [Flavobacteriia bacterium]